MSNNEIIVSLDIGTSKVRVIIGEINEGVINIIGVGSADSEGIRRGAIVDIEQTVQSIQSAVGHAERMVGITISDVYVGISGNHIGLQSSHGVVAVSNEDREIGLEDIERVMQAARVIALPPERRIIGDVPQQFLVDGLEDIHDPRGMIGVRLEVEATIITGAKTAVHNLERCVERAGLKINGLVLMSLASAQLSLSKDEMQLGTVLVDIGGGATTIAIFNQGNLVETSTLPIGGDHITNDISIGLRTQSDTAEKVKLKFGCALTELAAEDQVFKVARIGSNEEKQFTQVDLAQIIEPRVKEIFDMISTEVAKLGYKDIAGGYVLTGGSVSMPGMLEAAQSQLNSSVRIAVPDFIGVRDPAFTNGVGMIQYVYKYLRSKNKLVRRTGTQAKTSQKQNPFVRFGNWFKNWFSEFI